MAGCRSVMLVLVYGVVASLVLQVWSTRTLSETPSVSQSDCYTSRGDWSAEKHLIQLLIDNYERIGKNGRPVLNVSDPVPVSFGLGLIQMDLDEKNKVLMMSTWTRYMWVDQYLTWNPQDYENITTIRLKPDLIWIPDIMLYNTANVDLATREALVVVTSQGMVSWYPHTIFRSSCSVDVTNFPFDEQQCHMWFGSWTHNSKEVALDMAFAEGIDLSTFQSDYKESCSWEILNVTSLRKVLPDEKVDPNYIVLTFDLSMQRKMVFSSYILTLPCVFLACLTLVVFWLPPERPDRTSLAMSTFSSFMVLLLILVEAAPPTASSVPTLGVYYCFNMVIIMMSIILSSLVVNISRHGPNMQRAPKWIRVVIIGKLSRILFLHRTAPRFPKPHNGTNGDIGKPHSRKEKKKMLSQREEEYSLRDIYRTQMVSAQSPASIWDRQPTDENGSLAGMDNHLREVRKVIQRLEMKMEEEKVQKSEFGEILREWKYIGLVLDRFFFVVYLLLIIGSLSLLFPRKIWTSH